jgi:hypothetical protein
VSLIEHCAEDICTGVEYTVFEINGERSGDSFLRLFILSDGTRLSLQPNGHFIAAGGVMTLVPIRRQPETPAGTKQNGTQGPGSTFSVGCETGLSRDEQSGGASKSGTISGVAD